MKQAGENDYFVRGTFAYKLFVNMWYFTSDNDDRVIYVIAQTQQITIGRSVDNQQCNFAIPNDPSISRKHATMFVKDNTLFLQDVGSRYGTFINNSADKVEANIDIQLKVNDTIKFGKMNSVWKVNNITLNTCTSTLKGESLQKLKLILSQIGGTLKNEWDDNCNYLTMPSITLTIKVVLALVQGSYIVTPEYWTNFCESVKNFSSMPDPRQFMPTVVESTLNKEVVSFLPDKCRTTIFKDKKFIFFSKRQHDMYKPVLLLSGASPFLLSDSKMTLSMLCEQNVIVIQNLATGSQENIQKTQIIDITSHLKSKGKRVVADAEIGLAILYRSTNKYCNPSFSFTSEVVKQNDPVVKTSKVLAQESQETARVQQDKEYVKINETYGSDDKNDLDLNVERPGIKRKLSDYKSEPQFNPNKKVATTCYVADLPNESSKRRLSGDELLFNPSKKMTIEKENINQETSNSPDRSGKSSEMFNFISDVQNDNENKIKKLNLIRPQKRKLDALNDGDFLNFIQPDGIVNESETNGNMLSINDPKLSIFSSRKLKRDDSDTSNSKSNIRSEDISSMRGVKLKELIESNKMLATQEYCIKEESEELEDKMNALNLGNTIVTICNNLIVKREPFNKSRDTTSLVKNFKTFKKVWPNTKKFMNTTESPAVNNTDLMESSSIYSIAF